MTNYLSAEQNAVSQKFSNKKLKTLMTSTAIAAAGLVLLSAGPAKALPSGEQVVGGDVSYERAGNTLNAYQATERAYTLWDSFDTGADESVNIFTPGASSLSVNKVIGGSTTQFEGALTSNGNVWILNQNGVFFGATARIDTAGILASTGDVTVADVMDGDNKFEFSNFGTGKIENFGTMNIAEAGLAAFVAPFAANNGVINARLGTVAFAAGEKVTLDMYGDGLLEIAVDGQLADALLENSGTIAAEGGTVLMTADAAKGAIDNVINMEGVATVASATVKGGKIILSGGGKGTVNVAGKLDANGEGGGAVDVRGENITVAATADLSADGGTNGNGGDVVVFADNLAIIEGRLTARGGSESGNGGFIETSGTDLGVSDNATIDASAANGDGGLWLIDPLSIVIGSGSGFIALPQPGLDPYFTLVDAATISATLSGGTSVTLQTGVNSSAGGANPGGTFNQDDGDIRVRSNITHTGSGNSTFSLIAHDDIIVENGADIAATGSGRLNVNFTAGGVNGDIDITDGSDIDTNGGTVNFNATSDITIDDDIRTLGGNIAMTAGDFFWVDDSTDEVDAGTGNIQIRADGFALGGDLTGNQVAIGRGDSDGRISVGDDNGGVHISQSELNRITTNNLVIGLAGTGIDNDVRVEDADFFAFNQTVINTKTPSGGSDENVVFSGTNRSKAITVNADDHVSFSNNATLDAFGNVVLNTNLNNATAGDFGMGTNSALTANGFNVTINTEAVNLAAGAVVNAEGGNVDFNNKKVFTGSTDSVRTTGTGTIEINQWNGGSIQNAVNAVQNTGTGLNTINVGAGNYAEGVTVAENNFLLKGANFGINPNTGVRGAESNILPPGLNNGFTVSGDNVTVDGFRVFGGIANVDVSGSDNAQISNNLLISSRIEGVYGVGASNVDIKNNLIQNSGTDGVSLTALTGTNTITGNVIKGADSDGIVLSFAGNVTVQGNKIEDAEDTGIEVSDSTNVDLIGNTLEGNNEETAVEITDSTDVTASANIIDDFTTGFNVDGGADVTIGGALPADGNTLTSVEYGVLADGVTNLDIINNTMTGNSILGVHVLNSDAALVMNNILNEFATGVKVENSDNVQVGSNTITHSTGGTTGILVMGGSDDADVLTNTVTRYNIGIDGQNGNNIEIAGNTVNNSVRHGIRLLNATNSLIGSGVLSGGNIVNGTATALQNNGIQVTNGTGNRVWFNTVNDAGWDGISVFNSPNAQINDNRVNNSYRSAIALGASNGAQILRNTLNNNWGGMWLSGSNGVDVLNNTINTTTGWHGIYVAGAMDDLDIKTNTVDNANQSGIYVQNASNVRIGGVVLADGNTVTGAGVDGIYVTGLTGTNRIGYNTVTMSDSGDDDGIDVDNSGSMSINNNTVNNAGDNGIELSGNTAANTITGNAVNFAGWDGINVQFGNAFVDVSGNTVLDTIGASGIAFINHGGDGRVLNNTVRRSGRLGVYVGNASGLEITGNTVSDSGQQFGTTGIRWAGIHAEWANNTLIENNTVSVSSGDGINIGGSINGGLVTTTGNIVRNNVVYRTGLDGVSVDSSTGIQIRNNKIGVNAGNIVQGADNIGVEGIDVNNSAGAQITGNYIRETVSNGVSINPSPGSLIRDNNIADFGNNANGIYVLASDNTDVFGNVIDGNGTNQTGIRVQNSSNVDVGAGHNGGADRNAVTDVETGVAVVGGSNVTVDNNLLSNVNFGVDALNTLGTFTVTDNFIDADGGHNNGAFGVRVVNGATVIIGGGEGAWNAGSSDGNLIDDFTTGIAVDGATTLTVDNNDVTDGEYGLDVNAVTGTTTIVDNLFNADGGTRIGGTTGVEVTNSGIVLIGGTGNGNDIEGYVTGINLFNGGATTVTENDITDVTTGIRADDMFTSLWIDNNDIDANGGDVPASGFVGIHVTDSNNVQIGEGSFAGNTGNDVDDFQYGIVFVNGTNVTIDANDITDGDFGIHVTNAGNLGIFDNFADGRSGKPGNGAGYGIYVGNSFDAQIGALNDGNSAEDYVVGIRVFNSDSADVKYNDVDETTWNGIEIAFSDDVVVDRNTVDDSGWDNINVYMSNNADITNNALSDATGASGIAVIDSDGAYVFNNDIDRSARLGIYVGNGDNIVIDDNEIDDAGLGLGQWAGIHVEGSDNVTVTNNDIDDVDGDGINLGGFINAGQAGDNTGLLIANGNLIRNVAIDGIFGTANVDQVQNNTVYRTGDDGIEIKNSPDVQVTGNKVGLTTGGGFVAYNNIGGEGIRVTGSNGADILNNKVSDTVSHGIYLNPSHDAVIAGNDISGAGIDGIHVSGSDRVRIEDNDIFARTSAFNVGPHSDGAARDGIHVTGGEDAYILNNRVTGQHQFLGTSHEGAGRDGVHVEANNGVRIHSNNVSGQTTFFGNVDGVGRDGINVLNSDDADIRSNTVFRTGDDGIHVTGGNDAYVAFNGITRAGDDGIFVVDSFSADLFDNTVTNADEDGIHIENSDEAFVDFNEVYGGLTGIRVQNSDDVVVEDNYVADQNGFWFLGIGDGIFALNTDGLIVRFNTVEDVNNDGIDVQDSTNALVFDNDVTDTGQHGIRLNGGNNNTVDANTISFTNEDGVRVDGGTNATVSNNNISFTGDEGVDVQFSNGAVITGNTTSFTVGDGIQVIGSDNVLVGANTITIAFDDGVDIENGNFVTVSGNTIDGVNFNGIESDGTNNITVSGNFVGLNGFIGQNGIDVRNANVANILGNNVGTFVQGHGIFVDPSFNVTIDGNNVTGAGIDGIHVEDTVGLVVSNNIVTDSAEDGVEFRNVDDALLLSNVITNSGANGFFARGPFNGTIALTDNTFDGYDIGALFESGIIDLTGTPGNRFEGGRVGMRFAPAPMKKFGFAPMSLVGDTIGSQFFNTHTQYFVELDNEAFFAPGFPTILDATDSTFVTPFGTIRPSDTADFIGSDVHAFLESMFFHYVDRNDIGLFFFGDILSPEVDQEDILRQFALFGGAPGNVQFTINGLPFVDPAFALAALAPAAGGEDEEDGTPDTAEELAGLEPAAGGEGQEASCWGDAVATAGTGVRVNYNFGTGLGDALADAANCQTGEGI